MTDVRSQERLILAAGALGSGQFEYWRGVKIQAVPVQPGVDFVPPFARSEDFQAFERLANATPRLVEPLEGALWQLTDEGRRDAQRALAELGREAVVSHN